MPLSVSYAWDCMPVSPTKDCWRGISSITLTHPQMKIRITGRVDSVLWHGTSGLCSNTYLPFPLSLLLEPIILWHTGLVSLQSVYLQCGLDLRFLAPFSFFILEPIFLIARVHLTREKDSIKPALIRIPCG